jgi:hypothetical protein
MSDLACDQQNYFLILSPGPRPSCGQIVQHVYGQGANVDTDGDSVQPASTNWTWLYMKDRSGPKCSAVVEVCMVDPGETLMRVGSEDLALAKATAEFLAAQTGGRLATRRS